MTRSRPELVLYSAGASCIILGGLRFGHSLAHTIPAGFRLKKAVAGSMNATVSLAKGWAYTVHVGQFDVCR